MKYLLYVDNLKHVYEIVQARMLHGVYKYGCNFSGLKFKRTTLNCSA